MRAFLVRIIYLYLFTGCNQNVNAQRGDYDKFNDLIKYSGMTLETRYAECGEWGGHQEKLEITDSGKTLFLTYKVYRFNCDSLDYYYFNDNPPILSLKYKFLERQDLSEISRYILKLCQAKLDESLGFHAVEVYSVRNENSTLSIRYSGFDSSINMSYKKLLAFLFP
jgi:hypothetical protein